MTVTKGKNRRSNFFDKSGSSFRWPMIEIFILGDHKWFPIIRKKFLACLQKFIFLFLENLSKPVTTIIMIMIMIMIDHLKNFSRPVTTTFMIMIMIMTDRHNHSHNHDTVTDLLHFWVIAMALFAIITPPMAIFFYVDINRSHLSARDKEWSWVNNLRVIFEHSIFNWFFNHPNLHL